MSRLLVEPVVFVIAKTAIDEFQLNDWDEFNDFNRGEHGETPLDLLINETEDAGAHRIVEFAGRHCYRSWEAGRPRGEYIKNIIESGHGSVLEHATLTFAIQGVSRTLSHELVRHRVGVAISQESQRYVDAKEINFVVPPLLLHISKGVTDPPHPLVAKFLAQNMSDLHEYAEFQRGLREALTEGVEPTPALNTATKKRVNEAARSRLPNASETRLTWTANIRLLRHFFLLRGSEHADLEIRRLACYLHDSCIQHAPEFFFDMQQKPGSFGVNCIVPV